MRALICNLCLGFFPLPGDAGAQDAEALLGRHVAGTHRPTRVVGGTVIEYHDAAHVTYLLTDPPPPPFCDPCRVGTHDHKTGQCAACRCPWGG